MLDESQRKSVEEFANSAEIIARTIFENYKGPLQLDDVISISREVLVDAVLDYDPDRGASIKTYLYFIVRKRIQDRLRLERMISRAYTRHYTKLNAVVNSLKGSGAAHVYFEDIASVMGVSMQKLIRIYAKNKQVKYYSIHEEYPPECPNQLTPVEESIKEESVRIVREAILSLLPRTRAVISFCYYGGLKGHEIAEIFNISEPRVSQIKKNGLRLIRQIILTRYGGEYEI